MTQQFVNLSEKSPSDNNKSFYLHRLFVKVDPDDKSNKNPAALPIKSELIRFFSLFGEVIDCYLPDSANNVAYISYSDEKALKRALSMPSVNIAGVAVLVSKAVPRPNYTHGMTNRIFVKGMPSHERLKKADLIHYFSGFGEVVEVFIPRDHSTGKSKQFAFVTYKDVLSASAVLNLSCDGKHAINSEISNQGFVVKVMPAEARNHYISDKSTVASPRALQDFDFYHDSHHFSAYDEVPHFNLYNSPTVPDLFANQEDLNCGSYTTSAANATLRLLECNKINESRPFFTPCNKLQDKPMNEISRDCSDEIIILTDIHQCVTPELVRMCLLVNAGINVMNIDAEIVASFVKGAGKSFVLTLACVGDAMKAINYFQCQTVLNIAGFSLGRVLAINSGSSDNIVEVSNDSLNSSRLNNIASETSNNIVDAALFNDDNKSFEESLVRCVLEDQSGEDFNFLDDLLHQISDDFILSDKSISQLISYCSIFDDNQTYSSTKNNFSFLNEWNPKDMQTI